MSGYREKRGSFWWPNDRWTFPYISARSGYGLLAIGLFILVTGGSLILGAATVLIGAALLTYGLRNY
jgi:hypothetical protein